MAFLDNSGDIILDAVLTDAGRKRLARADGSFYVQKFCFGDDEIDYGSYNSNHSSGSAYYDLEILQTPILEAFTNNRSSLKSKLMSISNNNLLYLPELVLNENENQLDTVRTPDSTDDNYQPLSSGSFLISVNNTTNTELNNIDYLKTKYIDGYNIGAEGNNYIRIDQGLNTTELDAASSLASELTEQQYMIQIDNRLGSIVDPKSSGASAEASPSFIDDDQIATYFLTKGVSGYIDDCQSGDLDEEQNPKSGSPWYEVIPGPRGTKLMFSIKSSLNLRASEYLFDTIGRTGIALNSKTYSVIDSTIKVTGVNTGYSIDIPVTFARMTS